MSRVALSLFSGAGGLDLGIRQAGFEVLAAVDIDRDATATYAANFARTRVIQRDLLLLDPFDLRDEIGLRAKDQLDLIVGGPPCTPFSKSGLWLDWKRSGLDPDFGLVDIFGRYVSALGPRFFIMENVPGLASLGSPYRDRYLRFLSRLRRAGYMLSSAVLNAADVGVAQVRRRLFLVGELQGMSRSAAPPTLNLVASPVWRGAGDALAGLSLAHEPEEVLSGKWKDLIPAVPPGGNYLHFTERNGWFPPMFEWRSRYWSFLLKLDPLKPSPTIQAHPGPATGPFHWENRRLRLAEQCRLFGYPDDFVFVGSRSSAQRQIGNSVPPPLARFVAEQLGAPPVGLF